MLGAVLIATTLTAAGMRGDQDPRPPSALTGADWKAYSSQARQAYVSGFLAGAATAQAALTVPASKEDSAAAPSVVIARLRSEKRLRFPYAASVYSVQLDDYFWYTDRAGTPIVDVMADVNHRMLEPQGR